MQNVDLVTSELQSNIMNTRMQPVGNVFSKFPRIIRDMARAMGKEINLTVEGEEVELDKSIVEALGDPLTHLVRNSADHGIETPEARAAAGKNRVGQIALRAYHAEGQVNIEIVDDGKGIDAERIKQKALDRGILTQSKAKEMSERELLALIFLPGFSTAEKVSDVSGRGVGMDVVKTNIERMGGSVEIDSTPGAGTRINLRLPLTLAIIPSLVVIVEGRRFAVPQVSLEELVRIRAQDVSKRIEKVHGRAVLRLREKLLPLARLADILGLRRTFESPRSGAKTEDRRANIADRRAKDLAEAVADSPDPAETDALTKRAEGDRREGSRNAMNILVLRVGENRFGLIVDKLLDNEEIVVKPLSGYLKDCRCYSGATIMGDGRVAMILDAVGCADAAGLRFEDLEKENAAQNERYAREQMTETQSLLIFGNGASEKFALNLSLVARVEKVRLQDVEQVGDGEYLKYDDGSLRILRLHDFLPVKPPAEAPQEFFVIVPKLVRNPMGIVASNIEDIIETQAAVDRRTITGTGVLGSAVIRGELLIFVNIYDLLEAADPEGRRIAETEAIRGRRVLLAEDTAFFRTVELEYLRSAGCLVDVASNGVEAWDKLAKEDYDLLITDVVMPGMDGVELTKRVRDNERLKTLPVIALTSLTSEHDKQRIADSGVNAYEAKLDKESLLETMTRLLA
ncbi:MAG: Chemotaxis protein CheA [candidate division BRC1 bacterium ADurb.BinA364]|nr:MAG: Chemotaxis protein CheA [candidate division BRC1 bacterium ADurb.BinA364]